MAKSRKRKSAKKHRPVKPVAKATLPEHLKRYVATLDVAEVRKKARLLSLLFCDFCNVTDDRKLNLIGVFDRIYVNPEKRVSPPFVVYARTAEAFEDNLWLRIFDPDNEPSAEIRFDPPPAEFRTGRDPHAPTQVQFTIPLQLTFRKQGTYWFDIAYRDYSLGGAGLPVTYILEEGQKDTDAKTETYI